MTSRASFPALTLWAGVWRKRLPVASTVLRFDSVGGLPPGGEPKAVERARNDPRITRAEHAGWALKAQRRSSQLPGFFQIPLNATEKMVYSIRPTQGIALRREAGRALSTSLR